MSFTDLTHLSETFGRLWNFAKGPRMTTMIRDDKWVTYRATPVRVELDLVLID